MAGVNYSILSIGIFQHLMYSQCRVHISSIRLHSTNNFLLLCKVQTAFFRYTQIYLQTYIVVVFGCQSHLKMLHGLPPCKALYPNLWPNSSIYWVRGRRANHVSLWQVISQHLNGQLYITYFVYTYIWAFASMWGEFQRNQQSCQPEP